ncbi:MAG: metal ABC transporter substrate-binding protein [Alphaproteobacteria bacterium]|nr:metal ABC transporter substrate-binding protein [Alphaproteobacteria bacterium]
MKKNYIFILIAVVAVFSAVYFKSKPSSSIPSLKVGVTSGPHAMIIEHVREKAKENGLSINIVEFDDFILPNAALEQGDIQINCYQHKPFLDEQIASRKYKIQSIAKSVLMPMGVYSNKIKSLDQIHDKAKIGIPNDPTNSGRALLLLAKSGLIELKNKEHPTLLDITKNTKELKIIELDAPLLPRSLDDLDAAVINTDWVFLAKIDVKSAIYKETADSPYTNLIVIKQGDENLPEIKKFVELYQSEDTKKFIESMFKGAILTGW